MKIFEHEGILYSQVIPVKKLFNSTMVHEVITRGDIFAVRLQDMALTILSRSALKDEINAYIMPHQEVVVAKKLTAADKKKIIEDAKAKLTGVHDGKL